MIFDDILFVVLFWGGILYFHHKLQMMFPSIDGLAK
jgi:hypothetical protein